MLKTNSQAATWRTKTCFRVKQDQEGTPNAQMHATLLKMIGFLHFKNEGGANQRSSLVATSLGSKSLELPCRMRWKGKRQKVRRKLWSFWCNISLSLVFLSFWPKNLLVLVELDLSIYGSYIGRARDSVFMARITRFSTALSIWADDAGLLPCTCPGAAAPAPLKLHITRG